LFCHAASAEFTGEPPEIDPDASALITGNLRELNLKVNFLRKFSKSFF